MWRVWIIFCMWLTACAEFPEVDASLEQGESNTEYPELLPFDDLLSSDDPQLSESDDDVLLARAEALRNRADGIRGPVIDSPTRERMEDGIQQP